MNSVLRLILFLIAGLLFFLPTPGRADLAPITLKDGLVLPFVAHKSIRMDLQDVTIRMRKTDYTVDAVFRLFNTGETITQWVGVPRYLMPYFTPFVKFTAWVGDRNISFSEAREAGYRAYYSVPKPRDPGARDPRDRSPEWMVAQVTFPGHSGITIRIKYEAPFEKRNMGFYIYEYSRFWKDRIGKLVFTIDTTEICETHEATIPSLTGPGVRALTRNLLRDELKNYKPSEWNLFMFYLKQIN